ncbi:MAG: single-stranded DNA-binding protein [Nitrospiraceae bacterium]|nr:single-stranded DNA-binding protein [Nitrospiraceae bacterium]
MDIGQITDELVLRLAPLRFAAPVEYVYNPLVYARASWDAYWRRYGRSRTDTILLGMNPGPFGMAQTGVPFGDVNMVRDWMGIEEPVDRPEREHPKRPITGFECPRSEVSGTRLWSWARDRFGTPERFFARFFVCFMESSGRNRTPDKLPAVERAALFAACSEALRQTVACLQPRRVIGVGAFAEARAREALDSVDVVIGRMLHPSPASPAANRGWASAAERDLETLGVEL